MISVLFVDLSLCGSIYIVMYDFSAVKLSVYKLSDVRPEVRDGYLSLLRVLPANVTTR